MAKYITGLISLTGIDEGDRLRPTFLHFFLEVHSSLDMASSTMYDQLHFHFDDGKNFTVATEIKTKVY